MMVLATDAPLGNRNLRRLAARAMMGLARTGSWAANGSGDYVVAFSTAASVRRAVTVAAHGPVMPPLRQAEDVGNDAMSALFQAAVEATEEAIVNSLLMATSVSSALGTIEAIPLDQMRALFPLTGR
jgi:D-aminopeptidase